MQEGMRAITTLLDAANPPEATYWQTLRNANKYGIRLSQASLMFQGVQGNLVASICKIWRLVVLRQKILQAVLCRRPLTTKKRATVLGLLALIGISVEQLHAHFEKP